MCCRTYRLFRQSKRFHLIFVCLVFICYVNVSYVIKDEIPEITLTNDDPSLDSVSADYFKVKQTILSQNVPPILAQNDVMSCTNSTYLVIIVPSLPSDVTRRATIRDTWGRWGQVELRRQNLTNATMNDDTRLYFVLGRQTNLTVKEDLMIQDESKWRRDMIVADFLDTYKNLTLKTMAALRWVNMSCPNAKFILKADSDTFVHLPWLLQMLHQNESLFRKSIVGRINDRSPVLKDGKWKITEEEYPFELYPAYPNGASYVISGEAIPDLLRFANYMPYFPLEDVFIGILSKALGIQRISNRRFLYIHNGSQQLFSYFTNPGLDRIVIADISENQTKYLWSTLPFWPILNLAK